VSGIGDPGAVDAAAARIAEQGRRELTARLRAAFEDQLAAPDAVAVDDRELERLIGDAVARADGALWRRALAEAATAQLGITLADAVGHSAVVRAHERVGAPAYDVSAPPQDVSPAPHDMSAAPHDVSAPPQAPPAEPPPAAPDASPAPASPPSTEDDGDAVRLNAVHRAGIESLRAGERDLELRVTTTGVDVLKRSSGATIGRLDWTEVTQVELVRPRRGLRRRAGELHVVTARGRASFELPGVTESQLDEHLEPMLARRGGARS
jgi:hypothetical protein